MSQYRYKAFVSYSWADAAWGKWVQRALETYRTPKALVGQETPLGPVPATLHPLFKDREEQAAGASIGDAVEAALNASEFLIVICSPQSASSQWVNREIAWFKTHRDPAKILALIVEGEPGASAMVGRQDEECFPKALTHIVSDTMEIGDTDHDVPLAADARESGDGKRGARLKLAAAMLGVRLDELVRRDERRRTLRARMIIGASLALAIVMSAMAGLAIQARNEADHQRAESDSLVEFMLTDLREKLEPVGRLDALDVVGQRALKYYAGQKPSNLDADALGRRSRALHLVGEVRNIRGDSESALTAFRQAAATTSELLARDPRDQQRIFDHAQSVFWVGYIAYERGEIKNAETQFREYKRLAEQLVALDPKKPEWLMEQSYAESNLGTMMYEQGRFDEAEPVFKKALDTSEKIAAQYPDDIARQTDIGIFTNWLAKARAQLHQPNEALALHAQEIKLYENILKSDSGNTQAKRLMGVAWQHIGQLDLEKGRISAAIKGTENSLKIFRALRQIEPENTEWRESEIRAQFSQADNYFHAKRFGKSRDSNRSANQSLAFLISSDPTNDFWSVDLQSKLDVQRAKLKALEGELDSALSLSRAASKRLRTAKNYNPDHANVTLSDAELQTGDILAKMGRRSDARSAWTATVKAVPMTEPEPSSLALTKKFLALKRLGRVREASALAEKLDRQGYSHPAYIGEK